MDQQEDDNKRDIIHRVAFRSPRAVYRRSSPAEFGRENASACVTACFEEFIPNVEDACRQLQQPEYQRTYLWDLYCCDSTNCGVYIGNIGQSPNVDLIINECQNIGFSSIQDPGPPAINYCASPTPGTIITSLPPHTLAVESSIITAIITRSTGSIPPFTIPPSHTPSLTSEAHVSLAPTPIVSSSPASTGSPTSASAHSAQLPGGAKAAISVFSVIAVLAIAALLLLLFRRRRMGVRSNSLGLLLTPYDKRPYPGPRSGSLTPLITPLPSASSRSAPLTPPAKLSDRKYLQPVLREGASRPPASLDTGDQTFPSSPTRAPAQSRIIPRHKRRATTKSTRAATTTTVPIPSHYPQSSVYSSSSGPGASTITIDSNKASSMHSGSATVIGTSTPPSSTTRFPRGHDGSLELSDFVTPAGPPPSRALPAPPLNHPNSSSFPVPPVSPRSPTFPGPALVRGDSPIVPTHQGIATAAPVSISTQELLDLTESYARETRESWGSWSGVGGGGPGVTAPGHKRRRGNRSSRDKKEETKAIVARQELDLEKLSGRY
ncbi:hypothetical protein F4824DRAFT_77824 [Ustulina deusta]|nr:hypothetical protein F4824DRAFT_77824 [Ustulina deusta]